MCSTRAKRLFLALLLAHFLYAMLFIWRSSFVVAGERHFCLFDDAMISMRYARNLARGFGLTWNPGGERVEGFSNLLWTLLMTAWHAFPLPASKVSLLVQLTSEICLLGNLIVLWRISGRLLPERFALFATLCTAFYYPLNNWALQGMEVGALAFVLSASVWVTGFLQTASYSPYRVLLPIAVAMLLRPDGIVPYVVLATWLYWQAPARRRAILLAALTYVALVEGGLTLFRVLYYGEVAPNTYYLKMTGFPAILRISRGTIHAAYFWFKFLWPFAVLGAFACLRSWKFLPKQGLQKPPTETCCHSGDAKLLGLLATVVATQTFYSCYVGGDAWERIAGANRFMAPVVPFAFILGFALAHRWFKPDPAMRTQRWFIVVAFVIAGLVNPNMFFGPSSLAHALLIAPPLYRADNERNVLVARAIEHFTLPEATVAVDYAGVPAYFLERKMIDLLGKNDAHVARTPAHRHVLGVSPLLEFYPGHLKWDYRYSIGELRPDVVCAIWRRAGGDAFRYLGGAYLEGEIAGVSIYLRRDSRAVLWDRVPFVPHEVHPPDSCRPDFIWTQLAVRPKTSSFAQRLAAVSPWQRC